MKKLKIGYFIDAFFPMIDGVVMVVDNFAKNLSDYADVTVFAPRAQHGYQDDKFSYNVVRAMSAHIPFFGYSIPNPDIDIAFKRSLERSSLDIVHIHSPFPIGRMGLKFAKKNNLPLFATMHSQYKKDIKRFVKNERVTDVLTEIIVNVFEQCDTCFAVNDEIGRIFHEEYGYSKIPETLGNATDLVPINKEKSIRNIRDKYAIKNDEKILIFVGRITKLKNIMFICDVLYKMKQKGEKFKMLFVGSGENEIDLKIKVHSLNLADNVIFCGKITDRAILSEIYAAADLFLFPSLYDASSLVQVEAASQGLPVAFLSGAATAATVTDGVNGIISDMESYTDRVIEILHDSELHKKISDGAKRDLYVTWDDVTKKLHKFYLNASKI